MRTASGGLTRRRLVAFIAAGAFLGSMAALPAQADKPRAINARVIKLEPERFQFEVNIVHDDLSWEHFVDRWEVIGNGGTVLATDYLFYPRMEEDIVWRVMRGIRVEPGTEYVVYRLHDTLHGYGREKLVRMPTDAAPDTGWQ